MNMALALVFAFLGLFFQAMACKPPSGPHINPTYNLGNALIFQSIDHYGRWVCFVANCEADNTEHRGEWAVDPVLVPAYAVIRAQIPDTWQGNFHTVADWDNCGNPRANVIGEITFGGMDGKTWFDVSAVNSHDDNSGVHFMSSRDWSAYSGCWHFPCPDVFNVWNSKDQVKNTFDRELVVQIGYMGRVIGRGLEGQ